MKKTWETPSIMIQQFEANEYVAACWGVGCDVNMANDIEVSMDNYDYPNLYHGADHCGVASNQVIYDDNNDGIADRMIETGTDGLGNLACTLYTGSDYKTTMSVSNVEIGSTIYWTTTAGSGRNQRTWHHVGTVYATVPGHPNRS